MTEFRVVIPARYGSTRMPGKPLVDLAGKPMIVRVVEQVMQSDAVDVVVATDDERVENVVKLTGARAVMTDTKHASGSDRVMEVARRNNWERDELVVNVQGDEPLIPPSVINQVASLLADGRHDVATLYATMKERADVFDPNIVKLAVTTEGSALYFSRAPIPWLRDDFDRGAQGVIGVGWKRHIGIYAYRLSALEAFVALPPGRLETVESLEQLRFLENGYSIAVSEAVHAVPGGVDTQIDADRVIARLREAT
ncbi:MAG: 3-deoxy-manno-octulosonate cytidylyltransferase [Pseudomonadales bacterium]